VTAVEIAREAVQQEVDEFNVLKDMLDAAPGTEKAKAVPVDVWISQLTTVLAMCHQSNMKLLLAIEELEAR